MKKLNKTDIKNINTSISSFLASLAKKEIKAEFIAMKVIKNPKLLLEVLSGFLSAVADIKFKSAKVLVLISKEKPELLYPYFYFFAKQLVNKNNILKWNAIDVIASLTVVDTENKFDKLYKKFYGMLYEGNLITANHVIAGSTVIVTSKPYLEDKITKEILHAKAIPLPTEECRNILKGNAIKTFERYFYQIKRKDEIIDFVRKEVNNTRNAMKKKAKRFLKKFGKSVKKERDKNKCRK